MANLGRPTRSLLHLSLDLGRERVLLLLRGQALGLGPLVERRGRVSQGVGCQAVQAVSICSIADTGAVL